MLIMSRYLEILEAVIFFFLKQVLQKKLKKRVLVPEIQDWWIIQAS